MNKIKTGHFLGDGGIVNLPIGFIPDYFRMSDIDHTVSNVAVCTHEWFRQMEQHEAAQSKEGWAYGFATIGYTTLHADAAGITAYKASSQRPQIGIWAASGSTIDTRDGTTLTITARSATAPGTYVNPTVGSTADRQAIFEAITVGGNTGSTEPDWNNVAIGANVTDGSIVWKRVDVSMQRGGYEGVVIQDDIQSNTHEYYYLALQSNWDVDHGDVDGWTNGIDPNA